MTLNQNAGFSMVEVLIATAVVAVTLIAISSSVSLAVNNAQYSQEKSTSIRYAQEGIEWFRSTRDLLGWNSFFTVLNQEGSQDFYYCLETIPSSTAEFQALVGQSTLDNCNPISGTNFTRVLEITIQDQSTVLVTSLIRWQDATEDSTTELSTQLKEWR